MLICPEASKAQNNIAAVSADGSTVCVLIRRLNSSCKTFNCVRRPRAPPLAWRQSSECEQAVAGFLQAVGDGMMLEPPFADEGLAAALDLMTCRRIDHVGMVSGNLLVQALRRVGEQVPVLVDVMPMSA
jgi:hypothetical protein